MAEYKISESQQKALKKLSSHEIIKQNEWGTLYVKKGGLYFLIYDDGTRKETLSDFKTPYVYHNKGQINNFNITDKQQAALDHIGTAAKIDYQKKDGTLVVSAGKYGFTISPTGTVEEITQDVFKEKPEKKFVPALPPPIKETHAMTQQQLDLMEKHGQPEVVSWIERDAVVKLYGEKWIFGYDGISLSKKDYDKKYGGTASKFPAAPYSGTSYSYKTVCQERPERCKPRQIEHVAWDADQTIWNLKGTAASVTGPLKKIDADTVIELSGPAVAGKKAKSKKPELQSYLPEDIEDIVDIADGITDGLSADDKAWLASLNSSIDLKSLPPAATETQSPAEPHEINRITLFKTFRQTLDELDKKGIKSTIISLNTPGSVKRILKAFDLDKRFVEIRDSYQNKGDVFKELTHKYGYCPCSSIFVDDNLGNITDVTKECGLALAIGKGKDISEPFDIFNFIKDA